MKTMQLEPHAPQAHQVEVDAGEVSLMGSLEVPEQAFGIVVFAHGSGSSRHSTRNRHVARLLRQHGLGTLLFDLLTEDEERAEMVTRHLRFNIPLLARRVLATTRWLEKRPEAEGKRIGYFGASTGAAAALVAAADEPARVSAVVSRGGRPDLADRALERVRAPTLLIVGGRDTAVIELNEQAYRRIRAPKDLEIIPGATHLFEEPGKLDHVAHLAASWFGAHLR